MYSRYLDLSKHTIGKANTQRIERKHLTLRTRIKRFARRTICFSKSIWLRNVVIGLFVNPYEFGRAVRMTRSLRLEHYLIPLLCNANISFRANVALTTIALYPMLLA